VATPTVSATKKKSCSDYHVSGEGLPQNWMPVLMCGGVHIYGREAPRASAQEHRGGLPRAGAQKGRRAGESPPKP
jgi:hypothetical protein